MKKAIITILVLLLLIAGGVFLFVLTEKEPERTAEDTPKTDTTEGDKETPEKFRERQVMKYLQKHGLDTNFDGEVFADYYEFGQKREKLFVWAYIQEYYESDGELKAGSGHSVPMIITLNENGTVKKHWEPRPGEEYSDSIKDEFPQQYRQEVLNFQSRHQDALDEIKNSLRKRAEKELLGKEEVDRTVLVGEKETIELEANRSTGYKWHYNIGNKGILEVVSDEYQEGKDKEGVIGAKGRRIVEIKGIKTGKTVIKFEYYREWESEQVEKTKEIRVEVKRERRAQLENPVPDAEFLALKNGTVQVFDTKEEYPYNLGTTDDGEVDCSASFSSKTINGRQYCAKEASEGAAGTIHREYTYATIKGERLVVIGFTAVTPQCDNYEEPAKTDCEKEYKNFEQDEVAEQVVEDIRF